MSKNCNSSLILDTHKHCYGITTACVLTCTVPVTELPLMGHYISITLLSMILPVALFLCFCTTSFNFKSWFGSPCPKWGSTAVELPCSSSHQN